MKFAEITQNVEVVGSPVTEEVQQDRSSIKHVLKCCSSLKKRHSITEEYIETLASVLCIIS